MARNKSPISVRIEDLPQVGDLSNPACPSRLILDHVTGRWGGLIMKALAEHEVLRFAELRRAVAGVSEKMLAQTLRELVRDGLVNRTSYDVIPPRVEYALTPLGTACAARVLAVCDLVEHHMYEILVHQLAYDAAPPRADWQQPAGGPP